MNVCPFDDRQKLVLVASMGYLAAGAVDLAFGSDPSTLFYFKKELESFNIDSDEEDVEKWKQAFIKTTKFVLARFEEQELKAKAERN